MVDSTFDHVVGGLRAFGFRQQAEFADIAGGQLFVVGVVQRQQRHRQRRLGEYGRHFGACQWAHDQLCAIADGLLIGFHGAVGAAQAVIDPHAGSWRMVARRVEVGREETLADRAAGRRVVAIGGQQQGQVRGDFVAFANIGIGPRQQGADRLLQGRLRTGHGHAELAQRLIDPRQHAATRLHRGCAALQRPHAELGEQVEDLLAVLALVEAGQPRIHPHPRTRTAPAIAAGGHGTRAQFQQSRQVGIGRAHARVQGDLQCGCRIVAFQRQLGLQQVQAKRFVTAQTPPVDGRHGGGGLRDVAVLAPGFGGQQAVFIGAPR